MRRSVIRYTCVFVGLLLILVLASGSASARDQSLRGNRIDLFDPADPITIPASEPSFVKHGWGFTMEEFGPCDPGWTNMSAEERQERRDDAVWRFELFADGAPVTLERTFHNGGNLTPRQMVKWFFVQFEAGQFSPGRTVVFEGRWYGDCDDDDVSALELTVTRTVTFT